MRLFGGIVKDTRGQPISRIVRLYDRDTGQLLAQTVSEVLTGAWQIEVETDATEWQVVYLDDDGGTPEGDQVMRVRPWP